MQAIRQKAPWGKKQYLLVRTAESKDWQFCAGVSLTYREHGRVSGMNINRVLAS